MKFLSIIALSFVAISGCASVAVNDDSLVSRTSSALGLSQNDFVISNRVDSGNRTDYAVKTSKKQEFSCYVTGTLTYTGKVVSDAVCSKVQSQALIPVEATQPPAEKQTQSIEAPTKNKKQKCNELLMTAKKC